MAQMEQSEAETVVDELKSAPQEIVDVIVPGVEIETVIPERQPDIESKEQKECIAPSVIQAWETVAQEVVKEALVETLKEELPKEAIGGMVSATSVVPKDSPPPRVKKLMNAHTSDMSTFQYQILENIVQDSLADFRDQIRSDVQNMHLELLRQFQIQKVLLSKR